MRITLLIYLYNSIGDIMHFSVMNQHVIVLSSLEAVTELFEKQGAVYSDRFLSVMIGDLYVPISAVSVMLSLTAKTQDGNGLVFFGD